MTAQPNELSFSLTLKDPQPPAPWNDVYDATEEKSGCYEMNTFLKKIIGSEDSLFLNIFSKDVKPKLLQPVMVYIYGGAFQSGSSSTKFYAPDYLLMADVVLVTFNYRLGALGFMSLQDSALEVPGNAGLKDQRMALKFVKDNIENFGGDPQNITLFGQSAGGGSVSWHCVSESSKNLFNRAIMMSGCVLNSWALTPHRDWANRLAKKLGYEGNENEKEILDFLRKAEPEKIVEFQKTLIQPGERVAFAFVPHIEHYTSDETMISKPPIEMSRESWSNNIDVLIGGASDEGLMYLENIKDYPALLTHFKLESVVPLEVGSNYDNSKAIEFVENLKKIYYPKAANPTEDELAFCKVCPCNSLFISFIINHVSLFFPFLFLSR